jgi:hypothetical protein
MKIYVLLQWYYDGDYHLSDSFKGVYTNKEEAIEIAKSLCFGFDANNEIFEYPLNFITFVNYKTGEKSDVYIDGYHPEDNFSYNESKFEIREIEIMDKKESNTNEKDFEGLDYSKMFQNITEIDLSKWDKSKALDLATIISNKKESVLKKM